ncbi:MAG: hypothetical protein DHS20C01_19870 [marine bacterium B5-7]|nr:MAG: hypothetical protein DHS20C01_19870 [marine bacterium B5-7]
MNRCDFSFLNRPPKTVITLFLFALLMSGCESKPPVPPGLVDGRLLPCPDTPNCVNSDSDHGDDVIQPLSFTGEPNDAFKRARAAVIKTGGTLQSEGLKYLHATYVSTLFRFVDDLELRLDRQAGVIHIRSASRIGRSDFGANARRVKRLRKAFNNAS